MRPREHTADDHPRLDVRLALLIMVGTVLVCMPRFGHTTPDSVYYTDLVEYFRGLAGRETLQSPFAFRWVVPALAALLPGTSPETAMALCSVTATVLAYLVTVQLWSDYLTTPRQLYLAAALLVFSFPTLNYGSAALTDAPGFLVVAAACHAMTRHAYLRLTLILALGAGVRESTLLMVPVLWIYFWCEPRRRWGGAAILITLITVGAALASRWYFSDLPPYFWMPSWSRLVANVTRPISWATVLLTVAPLVGALFGCKSPIPPALRSFILAVAIPGLALFGYGVVAAYMSGRFCWPLYIALLPAVAWRCGGPTRLEGN